MQPSSDALYILERLGKFLESYGAWGVSAVLIILLVGLYWLMSKRHEAHIKQLAGILEKRNNQLVSLIQKCSTVISQAAHAVEDSNELLKQTQEIMAETREKNKDVENLVEKTNALIDVCLHKSKK